ncbi:MAG TPA: ABC transporter substrate-binding protein [Nitrospirota bacterium]
MKSLCGPSSTLMKMRVVSAVMAALFVFLGLAHPSCASAKTIGVIMSGDLPHFKDAHNAFVLALAKEGFGKDTVEIYVQSPNPDPMSWTNSVRKFVGVNVDVIVTYGYPATDTALRETNSIPVVFSYVYDPEGNGLKKRNSTGISSKVPMLTLLKTLKSITPYSRLAVIYSPSDKDSKVQFDEISKAAGPVGFQAIGVQVKNAGEVMGKLAGTKGCDSVYISSSSAVGVNCPSILGYAAKKNYPAISQISGLAEKGAILVLAPSSAEQGVVAARKVAMILKGGSPAKDSVESSKQIDLVLNLKTINKLGLKVPFEILNSATKVIK